MARGPFFTHRPNGFGGNFLGGDVRETLQREMNRVFDEIWRNLPAGENEPSAPTTGASTSSASASSTASAGSSRSRSLSLDVSETATEVRVRADLPGVAEDDVDVTLDDDRLTIRAERHVERATESETAHTSERSVGVLERTVTLPAAVDPEQVEAAFDRGVLTVTLRKPKASERGRKIPVRSASGGASVAGAAGSVAGTGATPPTSSGEAFMQGDGAMGASPSTGAGAEPATDVENAAEPGGAIHGYNE